MRGASRFPISGALAGNIPTAAAIPPDFRKVLNF